METRSESATHHLPAQTSQDQMGVLGRDKCPNIGVWDITIILYNIIIWLFHLSRVWSLQMLDRVFSMSDIEAAHWDKLGACLNLGKSQNSLNLQIPAWMPESWRAYCSAIHPNNVHCHVAIPCLNRCTLQSFRHIPSRTSNNLFKPCGSCVT